MRHKTKKKRVRAGTPVKRVSLVRKKRTLPNTWPYLVRCWWILRGAAAGVLVLGVLYGAYLGAGKIMEMKSLSVKLIEVAGCKNVQPDSIRQLTGVFKGDPLLKIDLKKVRRKVVSHPSIKDATVIRELPDTLRIAVKERVSTAVVLGGKFALVDQEGVVMSLHSSYPEGYPVVTGISEPLVPGRVIMELQPVMEVLSGIARSGLIGADQISELGVEGDQIKVSMVGTGTVLVLGSGNTDVQIDKLVRLMEAGMFDSRLAGYDLRFDGRVIGMPERAFDMSGEDGLPPAGG
jgi:cell division protein FtsQ